MSKMIVKKMKIMAAATIYALCVEQYVHVNALALSSGVQSSCSEPEDVFGEEDLQFREPEEKIRLRDVLAGLNKMFRRAKNGNKLGGNLVLRHNSWLPDAIKMHNKTRDKSINLRPTERSMLKFLGVVDGGYYLKFEGHGANEQEPFYLDKYEVISGSVEVEVPRQGDLTRRKRALVSNEMFRQGGHLRGGNLVLSTQLSFVEMEGWSTKTRSRINSIKLHPGDPLTLKFLGVDKVFGFDMIEFQGPNEQERFYLRKDFYLNGPVPMVEVDVPAERERERELRDLCRKLDNIRELERELRDPPREHLGLQERNLLPREFVPEAGASGSVSGAAPPAADAGAVDDKAAAVDESSCRICSIQ